LWINDQGLTKYLHDEDPETYRRAVQALLENLNEDDPDLSLEERISMSFPHCSREIPPKPSSTSPPSKPRKRRKS